MARFIRFDSDTEEVIHPADHVAGFSLGELYALIGTDIIEVVYLNDEQGSVMIVDEEGKCKKDLTQKVNPLATKLFMKHTAVQDDVIVGHAVICVRDEFQ